MARRGKNYTDHGKVKHNSEGKEGKLFDKENLMNGSSFSGRSQSSNGNKLKKNNKSSATNKKNSSGSTNGSGREKSKDIASHTNFPSPDSSSEARDQFEANIDLGNTSTGVANAGNLWNATRLLDALMGANMRALPLHVLKVANGWIEKQKPYISTFMEVINDAYNCFSIRIKIAYPVIRTQILHVGKIMFLLSMVWLDCSMRGLYSLVHLGTTSFFAVIWCSFLSLLAMIGITNMLILLVLSGLVAVFVGVSLSIIVIAITAAIVLWSYGSFWTSGLVVAAGGAAFVLRHERVALLLTTLYSAYCAKSYVGLSGLLFGLSLSFISSDLLIYILKGHVTDQRFNTPSEQETQSRSKSSNFYSESMDVPPVEDTFGSAFVRSADHDSGAPSTSGVDSELTSENEVVRLLKCNDHYSALGFARYENIDVSSIKREYKKKAMLVHPDKNMGNEKAVEAFKKLQNAYEVLLDSLKRKTYDDELRREEILNYFRRFQGVSQKNTGYGLFSPGFGQYSHDDEVLHGDSRRIACKKCKYFHVWICTNRSKSRARYCQDCKNFHQAKDGDGWVEQSSQPVIFGLMQKMDLPRAYVCAESRIYDATMWFVCQGMKCPANTHKPSFHVNTSLASKYNGKGAAFSSSGGDGGMPMPDRDDTMTEEELFEWLQNAMQSATFDSNDSSNESPSARTGTAGKSSSSRKKRKGKKQW